MVEKLRKVEQKIYARLQLKQIIACKQLSNGDFKTKLAYLLFQNVRCCLFYSPSLILKNNCSH